MPLSELEFTIEQVYTIIDQSDIIPQNLNKD